VLRSPRNLLLGLVAIVAFSMFVSAAGAVQHNWGPEHRHSVDHLTDPDPPHVWHYMEGTVSDGSGAEDACVKGTKTSTGTVLEFSCYVGQPFAFGSLCTPSETVAYFTAKWSGGSSRPETGDADTVGGC